MFITIVIAVRSRRNGTGSSRDNNKQTEREEESQEEEVETNEGKLLISIITGATGRRGYGSGLSRGSIVQDRQD